MQTFALIIAQSCAAPSPKRPNQLFTWRADGSIFAQFAHDGSLKLDRRVLFLAYRDKNVVPGDTVLITVHDSAEAPLANATVNGSWSSGASGSGSCVTNGSGQCSVVRGNLKTNAASVTFTVDSVSLSGSSYSAASNHDPDGDSNGTTIVVLQP